MSNETPESSASGGTPRAEMLAIPAAVALRDYLAGQAMAGMCAASAEPAHGRAMQLKMAETAYHIADAMIEKR
jgi:hypothetical protein